MRWPVLSVTRLHPFHTIVLLLLLSVGDLNANPLDLPLYTFCLSFVLHEAHIRWSLLEDIPSKIIESIQDVPFCRSFFYNNSETSHRKKIFDVQMHLKNMDSKWYLHKYPEDSLITFTIQFFLFIFQIRRYWALFSWIEYWSFFSVENWWGTDV